MLLFGAVVCLAVAGLGFIFTPQILRFMEVPQEIFDITVIYMRITFLGAPFTFFYNAIAAGMKSVGDSKTPLKFLMFSAILNAAPHGHCGYRLFVLYRLGDHVYL